MGIGETICISVLPSELERTCTAPYCDSRGTTLSALESSADASAARWARVRHRMRVGLASNTSQMMMPFRKVVDTGTGRNTAVALTLLLKPVPAKGWGMACME